VRITLLWVFALPLLAQKPTKPFQKDIGADRVEIYKSTGDVSLRMHIWEPEGHKPEDRRPAIVFFFGGGWRSGSPAQFREHCQYLSARGILAMSAEYRILGLHKTRATACVEDGKSALRWIRTEFSRLGVDPQRIAASGGSAGGHVAACTGLIAGYEDPDAAISSIPDAMILFNPALPERLGVEPKSLSPYHHVAKGQPPTLILHGDADEVVLIEGIQAFVDASTTAGNRCELAAYPEQVHGFFNFGRNGNAMYKATIARSQAFLRSLGWLQAE
jgi:acetyl esterase